MTSFRKLLLAAAATGLVGGGLAYAQIASPYDPQQLPETKGVVAQYDLTPRGDVDGLILRDGTEVHLPPHLSTELAAIVKPGGAVTIHGLKARALPLVQAMSITDDASGRTVIDSRAGMRPPRPHGRPGALGLFGPPGPREAGQELEARGTVKMQLHGPQGDFNGVLLDNGTMVHLPPPEATRLATELAVGKPVAATGFGVSNSLGQSIAARRIGPGKDSMNEILEPAPPPPPPPAEPG